MANNNFPELGSVNLSNKSRKNLNYPLLDSSGNHIGQIDIISVFDRRLTVEGWVLSNLVGLANADQKTERAPQFPREDVIEHFGNTGFKTPGFQLEIPFSMKHTIFWAEVGGIRYAYPLPEIIFNEAKAS